MIRLVIGWTVAMGILCSALAEAQARAPSSFDSPRVTGIAIQSRLPHAMRAFSEESPISPAPQSEGSVADNALTGMAIGATIGVAVGFLAARKVGCEECGPSKRSYPVIFGAVGATLGLAVGIAVSARSVPLPHPSHTDHVVYRRVDVTSTRFITGVPAIDHAMALPNETKDRYPLHIVDGTGNTCDIVTTDVEGRKPRGEPHLGEPHARRVKGRPAGRPLRYVIPHAHLTSPPVLIDPDLAELRRDHGAVSGMLISELQLSGPLCEHRSHRLRDVSCHADLQPSAEYPVSFGDRIALDIPHQSQDDPSRGIDVR